MCGKKRVVIFGLGDLARLAALYFEKDSPYDVVAFTAHQEYITNANWLGRPVVPFEQLNALYPPSECCLFVGIGFRGVNRARADIYESCKSKGYDLISYLSSRAINLSQTKIGENCFILEGAIIQPFVTIGNDVIIWAGSHIGHDSVIGDHTFIAPCAAVSGNVRIERYCFIGINATLRDGISIGEGCVIGAGVTILRNTQAGMVYAAPSVEPTQIPACGLRGF